MNENLTPQERDAFWNDIQQSESDESTALMIRAKELEVVDSVSLEQMKIINDAASAFIKEVKAHYEPMKKNSYKTWKDICNKEKEDLEKAKDAIEAQDSEQLKESVETLRRTHKMFKGVLARS